MQYVYRTLYAILYSIFYIKGLVNGLIPLLSPGSIYPVDQDLVMELEADSANCPGQLSPKHSSLAHQTDSRQVDSKNQDSVPWSLEARDESADPGNLVHHCCSKVDPHLRHCIHMLQVNAE